MVEHRKKDRVLIFDTTLRDGEQSPGASLNSEEKLLIARKLAELGTDVIEAGFPAASPGDLAAVMQIAREVGTEDGPVIAGLARAHRQDIELAWQAVEPAAHPRIHTFLATSDLHMKHKLVMSRDEVVDRVAEMVSFSSSLCSDVEFTPEDAGRSDPEFLVRVLRVAIEAGATTLNIADTVGYMLPEEYGLLMANLIRDTDGSERAVWSVHCHDDLGLATANTLAGLQAGARQAEVTINGIGERAGNASLEEVVMAIATRQPVLQLATGIDARKIIPVSRLVSDRTGISVPPNKAIVGRNAFAHEAGIHQDGVLKDQRTYEIMTPESVGLEGSELVLGKHSGRHAFRRRLEFLSIVLTDEEVDQAFHRFKQLADHQKEISDRDLMGIAHVDPEPVREYFKLVDVAHTCQPGVSTSTVRIAIEGAGERTATASGKGSIDALYRALERATDLPNVLRDYRMRAMTPGVEALGEASVVIAANEGATQTYSGTARDANVFLASAKAYLAALNRLASDAWLRGPRATDLLAPVAPLEEVEKFESDYTWGIP